MATEGGPSETPRATGRSASELAGRLLADAVAHEQAAHRLGPHDDVPAIRAAVRRGARAAGVAIRTGLVDDALVVVRADAAVWHQSAAEMRAKLTPPA